MNRAPDEIILPKELKERLASDASLDAIYSACVAWTGKLLARNQAYFFPDFTDHGLEHVNAVTASSWEIAAADSRARLTSVDCLCLALSALLHDIALHIGREGFADLVLGAGAHRPVPWFEERLAERSWPALWADFRLEVGRWDRRKCEQVCGTEKPVALPAAADVRDHDWRDSERKACGEFIRRHHGRMAHEFAVHGFPLGGGASEPLIAELAAMLPARGLALRDLCGLIARSHTSSLRLPVEYLIEAAAYDGNCRNPYDCHATYLMALLRIADYLQIQPERAKLGHPELLKTIRSPVSRDEWRLHLSVAQINFETADPEAISILVAPDDVATFLHARSLFDAIQEELDHSWAVLGEVYGRADFPAALMLRRIRSNIDDLVRFAKTVDYLPTEARFRVSDPQIVDLLIRPLYGDSPDIGVRELIQNAVDAVNELEDLIALGKVEDFDRSQLYPIDADVLVSIETDETGEKWLCCTDRGRGMDESVVLGYFLNVGASFRMSDAWRSTHERKDDAPIARTGRFGIGVLAAFLIGDRLKCTTRSVHETKGLYFEAAPGTGLIELRRAPAPVGTSIRVRLPGEAVIAGLATSENPWYYGKERRLVFSEDLKRTGHTVIASQPNSEPACDWIRINQTQYDAMDWSPFDGELYGDKGYTTPRKEDALFCNGFYCGHLQNHYIRLVDAVPQHEARQYILSSPPVSFVDRDGVLPLRLDRQGLVGDLPLVSNLTSDIIDNMLVYWVMRYGIDRIGVHRRYYWINDQDWKIARQTLPQHSLEVGAIPEVVTPRGSYIFDILPSICRPKEPIVSYLVSSGMEEIKIADIGDVLLIRELSGNNRQETSTWLKQVIHGRSDRFRWISPSYAWIILGPYWNGNAVYSKFPKYITSRIVPEEFIGKNRVYRLGNAERTPQIDRIIERAAARTEGHLRFSVAIAADTPVQKSNSKLVARWLEVIGQEIPDDPLEREKLLERMITEHGLGRHVAFWRNAIEDHEREAKAAAKKR